MNFASNRCFPHSSELLSLHCQRIVLRGTRRPLTATTPAMSFAGDFVGIFIGGSKTFRCLSETERQKVQYFFPKHPTRRTIPVYCYSLLVLLEYLRRLIRTRLVIVHRIIIPWRQVTSHIISEMFINWEILVVFTCGNNASLTTYGLAGIQTRSDCDWQRQKAT